MSDFAAILTALTQQKADLEAQVSRINGAIDALAGVSAPSKKQAVRKVSKPATTKRARKPMTAAQKKLVSARMKKYWAARKRAKR